MGSLISTGPSVFADSTRKIHIRLVKKVPLPKGYHEGLFFDGKNIWVCNGKGGNIWIIDPSSGNIVSEVTPPGSFTEGIAKAKNGTYWVTDWDDKKIYYAKVDNNKMIAEYERSVEPSYPTGLVFADEMFYVIKWTRGPGGTKYHLMQISEDERLLQTRAIKGIPEPAHLAWDGKNLWITSWYDRHVYKIDANTFEVTGAFRSPAADATGIVWDGRYFWITGTHADLYQIEIK